MEGSKDKLEVIMAKEILEFLWSLPPMESEELEYEIHKIILLAEHVLEEHGVDLWSVI